MLIGKEERKESRWAAQKRTKRGSNDQGKEDKKEVKKARTRGKYRVGTNKIKKNGVHKKRRRSTPTGGKKGGETKTGGCILCCRSDGGNGKIRIKEKTEGEDESPVRSREKKRRNREQKTGGRDSLGPNKGPIGRGQIRGKKLENPKRRIDRGKIEVEVKGKTQKREVNNSHPNRNV